MATFAFIHGAGDVGWYWHLVEAELRRRGHDTVAPDLPVEDDERRAVAIRGRRSSMRSGDGTTSSSSPNRSAATSRRSSRNGSARDRSSSWPGWCPRPAKRRRRCSRTPAGNRSRSRTRARGRCSTTTSRQTLRMRRSRTSAGSPTRRAANPGRSRPGPTSRRASSCAANDRFFPARLAPAVGSRSPWDRPRRDRQRPLPGAEPSARARRAPRPVRRPDAHPGVNGSLTKRLKAPAT